MEKAKFYRSFLYVPANNARAVSKAPSLGADHIVLDLEDAVGSGDKHSARVAAVGAIKTAQMVRVNDLSTAYIADDLRAFRSINLSAIMFPKVNSLADVLQAEALMDALGGYGATQIWVMLETAKGILNAADIMTHPRVAGCFMGTNDLSVDLKIGADAARSGLQLALQMGVMAARAAGKICVDGTYNRFDDALGFQAECAQGRMLGFDGKSLIHPAQIATANTVFGITPDQIAQARRIVAAFAAGSGSVVSLDGEMIEDLHARDAQAILDQVDQPPHS